MAIRDGVKVHDEVIAKMVDCTPEKTKHQITVNIEQARAHCSCGAEWVCTTETALDQFKCPNDK
jgi:hypothetical protein